MPMKNHCNPAKVRNIATSKQSPLTDDDILAAARAILAERVNRADVLTSPNVVADYLATQFAGMEREVFVCLFLDNRHRLIRYEELFRGTIDGCTVHPREVVKAALRCNAAAVILAHNHPSGVAEPSAADHTLTTRLKAALALVDIRVLDHVVVGGPEAVSFAERGIL
jgi:DNA repair protein RadC